MICPRCTRHTTAVSRANVVAGMISLRLLTAGLPVILWVGVSAPCHAQWV